MPAKNPDLHGNVPDKAPVAAFKARARAARIPAIDVNDNLANGSRT